MKVGQKFNYQPKGASTNPNVASTSSKVSNQQVPPKPRTPNANNTKSAPSSSNANNSNVNNATSGPQPEVNKNSAKQQYLPKEPGIKITNSFDALNAEMENDVNLFQSVDVSDDEDDLVQNDNETTGFLASTSKGPTNTTGASTLELHVPDV